MNRKYRLLQLFFVTFKISACTFGGGFVIIPLLKRKFVEELGWIENEEMLDLAAIAQSSPGAIAVNAAILVGYRTAGIIGALVTILGTVLPPLIIISIISAFYQSFRENKIVSYAMSGMLCGVAAVIFDVVLQMIKDMLKQKRLLPVLVMIGVFMIMQFFSVNVILIILVCGMIGAADLYSTRKKMERLK